MLCTSIPRPDDYFAEMAKSDEHMQKVRKNLMKKRVMTQRSEKLRQMKQQKKVAKQMQGETILKKDVEKRKSTEELKTTHVNRKINPKAQFKMQIKAAKFGCGGDKKCCSKWNTRSSSADVFEYRSE
ncbi:Putative rRNA-processing protein EBP2-like protein [Acromyrmex echinatior]|uniref:Putative rRNA-processing protein EBP2-like protein n=1 Tax=Acromyrmex echinatior TaxID=103372 RepID=F4WJN4_ACREC|nr:Putative rRNA-processing protein EBP2-like protein [Acromyrmex echinatior]